MNALGLIFCDRYSNKVPKTELIHSRSASAIPFAGRYRLIDFTLSSMVNADINEIGIICNENYGSLIDHIGNGKDWDLNRRKGGIKLLTPLARPESLAGVSRGRLDALRSVRGFIADTCYDWVVLAFGGTVANIDLEAMLAQHIANDAYLTLAYANTSAGDGEMMVKVEADNTISALHYQRGEANGTYALGTAMMKKADLLEFLDEAEDNDYTHLNRDLIQRNLGVKKICGYAHQGYAHIVDTIHEYFDANMEMLDLKNKASLFDSARPVYTKVKDSVPTLYDFNAKASNCLIADGCVIKGTIKNSVLGRNVTIEEGAIIENSIIMQNTTIGRGAELSFVVADKNVKVQEGVKVQGTKKLPFVIGKGKEIE